MRELLARSPVVLAPMEDVTDAAFRRACRSVGAELCVTEFVHVDHVIASSKIARRKLALAADDRPTAIQIYGADPERLLAAAQIAERVEPAYIDLNCGCWVPHIARAGAGAGWLRDPAAMVAMASAIVRAVALPVTVKTRIGWGPESHMPIVDLARRLEDAGIAALTIHCRTALAGHAGPADWSWAARAREVVSIPVIVNGDVRTADDVVRALDETGCAAAMIGRGAIDHPWVFREARAALRGERIAGPSDEERRALFAMLSAENVALRGERVGIGVTRRHARVLGDQVGALRPRLFAARSLAEVRDVLGA
ncbi:MAG: tRNA dihydrouridine synthase [Kofleriaceae bacterium]